MAKAETPATTAPATAVFEVDETQLKTGRKVVASLYLSEVTDAVEGKAYGIPVADKAAGTKALNELRKAATQTGRKLRTWNKSTEAENPYVAFKVVPPAQVETPGETS